MTMYECPNCGGTLTCYCQKQGTKMPIVDLEQKLASAQAENLKLRELIRYIIEMTFDFTGRAQDIAYEKAKATLATQPDYSALRAVCLEVAMKFRHGGAGYGDSTLERIVDEVLRCKS